MAGPEVMRQLGSPQSTSAKRPTQLLDGKPVSVLLRHHGDFIDTVLIAICEGESISLAGRQAMAYTADRLRQIAEVVA